MLSSAQFCATGLWGIVGAALEGVASVLPDTAVGHHALAGDAGTETQQCHAVVRRLCLLRPKCSELAAASAASSRDVQKLASEDNEKR